MSVCCICGRPVDPEEQAISLELVTDTQYLHPLPCAPEFISQLQPHLPQA